MIISQLRRLLLLASLAATAAWPLANAPLAQQAGASVTSAVSADYASLLQQYRSGNADLAVATFVAWPAALVERETASIGDLAESDPWQLAARVLLHTEAGRRRGDFASAISGRAQFNSVDQLISLEEYEVHYRRAATQIELLFKRAATDPRLAGYVRDWHVLATPNAGGFPVDWETLPGAIARKRFPLDSASWLLFGSFLESSVTHQFAGEGFAYRWGFIGRRSLQAYFEGRRPDTFKRNHRGDIIDLAQVQLVEHAFRRAIELDPTTFEARLRLGHVLWLADRYAEAEAEFRTVTENGTGPDRLFSAYLAWLWLGQMQEANRSWAEAAGAYEHAAAVRPGARSARLAMAALRARLGETGPAWRAAVSLLESPNSEADEDPITLYPLAQTWRHERLTRNMRQQIRR